MMRLIMKLKKGKTLNVPASKLPKEPEGLEAQGDFRASLHWKVLRIFGEFVDGFQFIADFKKTVTFFGSARFAPDTRWYQEAQRLAQGLGKQGFSIITGGGPGIMEAANRGAHDVDADSVGLNIQLPHEQRINDYLSTGIGFHYFFTRKLMLSYSAQVYVFFPGGFGTLDEFLEILTLVQTNKIERIPIILVGKEYWEGFLEWVEKTVLEKFAAIDKEDMRLYTVVDTAEEALALIRKSKPRKNIFF